MQQATDEDVLASVPSSKAITEAEFKVIAKKVGKANNLDSRIFDEKLLEEMVKSMLIGSHEAGINKVPDNTYGAVSDYNESVKKQYMV